MKEPIILRVALPVPRQQLFEYIAPQGIDCKALKKGVRVRVPFRSKTLTGILIETAKEPTVSIAKLKYLQEILDEVPKLTTDVIALCEWAADYYHYAFGEVIMGAFPSSFRKGKAAPEQKVQLTPSPSLSTQNPFLLNESQQQAVAAINTSQKFSIFLLDGVTGSGKTEVYLQTIQAVLQQNKQVLVLVPEISLTPQTINRFAERFSVKIALLHSGLSEKKRLDGFEAARVDQAKIVIGTRSALFTPFKKLGLIIVDEEHDASFKQQDRFRYHARDLAIKRASLLNIPIVLGSATPSLESLLNTQRNKYHHLILPERAGNAQMPSYQIVDMRSNILQPGFSTKLIERMRIHLQENNQVLLFLNKRGFSPVLYCTACRAPIECKRCDANMVYHQFPPQLHCHHCNAKSPVPTQCPCGAKQTLQPIGCGTQRLEETLKKHFPTTPILRIDKDSTMKKGALQLLLDQIHLPQKAILLGTQILAKGHHFPNVTLVGVMDADSGLFSADFRATEQMGQLLLQVSGRAGRAEKKGETVVQTRNPHHPLLSVLTNEGYHAFAKLLLQEREENNMPPYVYYALFRAIAYQESQSLNFLKQIKGLNQDPDIIMMGPAPALLAKRKGLFCYHLLMKANKRSHLNAALKKISSCIEKLPRKQSVKWSIDVDPLEVV